MSYFTNKSRLKLRDNIFFRELSNEYLVFDDLQNETLLVNAIAFCLLKNIQTGCDICSDLIEKVEVVQGDIVDPPQDIAGTLDYLLAKGWIIFSDDNVAGC